MCKGHEWGMFIFGAILIVFTFVSWAAAKWIFFAIGILLVLHALFGNMCKESCSETKQVKKPVKKKAKKKRK